MVPEDEAWHTVEFKDYFVIQPNFDWWDREEYVKTRGGKLCCEGFSYNSGSNTEWLTVEELKKMIEKVTAVNHFE